MIQILGLRPYVDAASGKTLKSDTASYKRGWRAPSVPELFADIEKYLEQVPESERWDLFYTVQNCTENKREFASQEVLPIDIDGIHVDRIDEYVDVVLEELALPKDKVGIVASGNGLHILIGLKHSFTETAYFDRNRVLYKAMCGRINFAMYDAGLVGNADPSVFCKGRILRMPLTENRKDPSNVKKTRLLNRNIEPIDISLQTLADLPSLAEGDQISPRAMAKMPDPDADAVLSECGFLVYCRDHQEQVTEPEWYAMLSIVGRLPNGSQLIHEYSAGYPGYDADYTDMKAKHALESAGPRTCVNICGMYNGCTECPHYGKVTSPIQIVGENHIRTKETGFYNMIVKNGVVTQGRPNYDDLLKYYQQLNEYVSLADTEQTFAYTGTHWVEQQRMELHNFAETNFDPSPSSGMCSEFESKVRRTNLRPSSFIQVDGKLNFANGVLDLESGIIFPHSPDYGFTYTIPYDYEPKGDCPEFKKFIREVSCGNDEVAQTLVEYMGFCLSGADPKLVQKCAILYGDGSNGKSVLIHLMRELVGFDNCSAVSIDGLRKDTHRYQLMHKMFNVADETPNDAFVNSSIFKSLVSGDTLEIRRLYANPIMWKCNTKFMFACNDLPFNSDFSYGMFRRLLIIPFNNTFSHEKGNIDPHILDKLLKERCDIFAYCLEAFKELKGRGYQFVEAKLINQQLDEYKELSDSVARFVGQTCDFNRDRHEGLNIDAAYKCYFMWCQDNNAKAVAYGSFVRRFGRVVGIKYPAMEKIRSRGPNGSRITEYKGLTIAANNF